MKTAEDLCCIPSQSRSSWRFHVFPQLLQKIWFDLLNHEFPSKCSLITGHYIWNMSHNCLFLVIMCLCAHGRGSIPGWGMDFSLCLYSVWVPSPSAFEGRKSFPRRQRGVHELPREECANVSCVSIARCSRLEAILIHFLFIVKLAVALTSWLEGICKVKTIFGCSFYNVMSVLNSSVWPFSHGCCPYWPPTNETSVLSPNSFYIEFKMDHEFPDTC